MPRQWLRMAVVPPAFGLPTGVLFPMAPHIPLPFKILIDVLDPIAADGDPDDRGAVQRRYHEITGAMQSTMDRLVRRLSRSIARRRFWGPARIGAYAQMIETGAPIT